MSTRLFWVPDFVHAPFLPLSPRLPSCAAPMLLPCNLLRMPLISKKSDQSRCYAREVCDAPYVLFLGAAVRLVQMIFTFGAPLPAGCFTPSLCAQSLQRTKVALLCTNHFVTGVQRGNEGCTRCSRFPKVLVAGRVAATRIS